MKQERPSSRPRLLLMHPRAAVESDADGAVLEVLIQRKRDTRAAARLMRKLLKQRRFAPTEIAMDRLRSVE